jgi:uncharacterized membrane protein
MKATSRPFVFWMVSAFVVSMLLGLVLVAPLAAAGGYQKLALGLYGAFGTLCHQLPERSYFIDGHKLAVCSRCTGLYAGFAFTLLLYPLIRSLKSTTTPPRGLLLLAAVPMAVDFSINFFGFWNNTHSSRFLTGALLGSIVVFYVVPGIVEMSLRSFRRTAAVAPIPTFTLSSPESIASAPSDYSAPDRRI